MKTKLEIFRKEPGMFSIDIEDVLAQKTSPNVLDIVSQLWFAELIEVLGNRVTTYYKNDRAYFYEVRSGMRVDNETFAFGSKDLATLKLGFEELKAALNELEGFVSFRNQGTISKDEETGHYSYLIRLAILGESKECREDGVYDYLRETN